MPTPSASRTIESARSLLKQRIDYQSFLAKLAVKDRAKVEKQIAAYEAAGAPERAKLWQRLACALLTLAPHQPKVNAQQTVQFYIADGRHRKQIFALEDAGGQALTVYCTDVLEQALAGKVLQRESAMGGEETTYRIPNSTGTLFVERLDADTVNLVEFFKHLVGWNRKALRIALPVTASEPQIAAVELLCGLSMLEQSDSRPTAGK